MAALNVANRTLFNRDNLDILHGINDSCIDLIYLDPPFNKKKTFTAPIGSSAEGASFTDIFRQEDIKDEWVDSIRYENHQLHEYLKGVKFFSNQYNYCYLVYMAVRLMECHRILKNTGSLYLHCDPTMSHYLKIVLDCIFGEDNFRNEVVWSYSTGGVSKRHFAKKHDIILFYSKTSKKCFNQPRIPSKDSKRFNIQDNYGKMYYEKAGNRYYLDEGVAMTDVWDVYPVRNVSKERTGYPTQKPLALLERIVQASSNKGDVVLDPFCGCATTCIAAEKLERQWIGIDVSVTAYDLVRKRMRDVYPDTEMFKDYGIICQTTVPTRTAMGTADSSGFVYVIKNAAWKARYKVGIAKDVGKRLKSYQTSDPHRGYELVYSRQSIYYREIEKYIHKRFDSDYEWVLCRDEQALIEAIEKYKKAPSLLKVAEQDNDYT